MAQLEEAETRSWLRLCIYINTLYVTNIVVFLTAFSIRVSLLSSKTHNGDDTPKDQTMAQ